MFVKETLSTNMLLKEMLRTTELPEGYVVRTDFQTNGKGQGSNVWESEGGKNLLFSLLLRPIHVHVGEQFLIAQIVSLSIVKVLNKILSGTDRCTIKWPNDIYWKDKKLGGMLIENVWQGQHIASSIVGIGLNVNQAIFYSDAPNPVSLLQILGTKSSRTSLLRDIVDEILDCYKDCKPDDIRKEYVKQLYRGDGYHPFKDKKGIFNARIVEIEKDGKLVLIDTTGKLTGYYFKEVEFIMNKNI